MGIDAVYVIGQGSPWEDNELRYSLRSLHKYVKNVDKIFIVGHCPDWLVDVIHIPMEDIPRVSKDFNIYRKVYKACGDPRVSEEFLFMSDDNFFNEYCDATKIPYRYCQTLTMKYGARMTNKMTMHNLYNETIANTINILAKYDAGERNYDIHYPVRYDKNKFIGVMGGIPWQREHGFCINSIYCNMIDVLAEKGFDCKINTPLAYADLCIEIHGDDCFSVGDKGLNQNFKTLLEDLYQEASPWEKPFHTLL